MSGYDAVGVLLSYDYCVLGIGPHTLSSIVIQCYMMRRLVGTTVSRRRIALLVGSVCLVKWN